MAKVIISTVILAIFVSISLGAPADFDDDSVQMFAEALRGNVKEYGITCENVEEKCKELAEPYLTDDADEDADYEERLLKGCKFGYAEYLCNGRNKDSDMSQLLDDMIALTEKKD